jgi:hypothetical protein
MLPSEAGGPHLKFGVGRLKFGVWPAAGASHKFDPIATKEFYSLFSFFQSAKRPRRMDARGKPDPEPRPDAQPQLSKGSVLMQLLRAHFPMRSASFSSGGAPSSIERM